MQSNPLPGTKHNPNNGLTQKQKIACDHYLEHGHKANAYRHAYNTDNMQDNTVNARACELFQHPNVQRYISEVRNAATSEAVMTQQEALEILSNMARGKLSDYLTESGEVDAEKVARSGYSLESFDVAYNESGSSKKIKIRNPVQAIERLSRMLGWDKQANIEGVIFNIDIGE